MMNKFKRSWKLATRSIAVVWENRRLLVFPVITVFFLLVAMLFFIAPLLVWNTGYSCFELEHWKGIGALFGIQPDLDATNSTCTPLAYSYIGAFYLVSMVTATFSSAAFYNEILHALNGNPVSFRRGYRMAVTKWRAILTWSLFSGLVGLLIRAMEERMGFVGRWMVRLIGVTWSVASVFAIPVIIREEKASNPLHCLRSSAVMFKKTWGESAIGFLGLQIVSLPMALGSLVLLGGAIALCVWAKTPSILAGIVGLYILLMIVVGCVIGVASHVYRVSLFIYASEGVIPASFDREMMDMAWKIK